MGCAGGAGRLDGGIGTVHAARETALRSIGATGYIRPHDLPVVGDALNICSAGPWRRYAGIGRAIGAPQEAVAHGAGGKRRPHNLAPVVDGTGNRVGKRIRRVESGERPVRATQKSVPSSADGVVANHLPQVVDAGGGGLRRAGDADDRVGYAVGRTEETVPARRVLVEAHHLPAIVDARCHCGGRPRRVEGEIQVGLSVGNSQAEAEQRQPPGPSQGGI